MPDRYRGRRSSGRYTRWRASRGRRRDWKAMRRCEHGRFPPRDESQEHREGADRHVQELAASSENRGVALMSWRAGGVTCLRSIEDVRERLLRSETTAAIPFRRLRRDGSPWTTVLSFGRSMSRRTRTLYRRIQPPHKELEQVPDAVGISGTHVVRPAWRPCATISVYARTVSRTSVMSRRGLEIGRRASTGSGGPLRSRLSGARSSRSRTREPGAGRRRLNGLATTTWRPVERSASISGQLADAKGLDGRVGQLSLIGPSDGP